MANFLEPLIIAVLPVAFLTVFFAGDASFKRKNIDMGGEAPIPEKLFIACKYVMLFCWVAMILQGIGLNLSFIRSPGIIKGTSLGLWIVGFGLLFAGRFNLGSSFRMGCAKESTALRIDGLYRFSRNPMYLGIYCTLLAAILYTMNPVILLASIFVATVHHRIVMGEEASLRNTFGQEYTDYCRRVGRYL